MAKPWTRPGFTFMLDPVWPPGFVSRIAPPSPREICAQAIARAQQANRAERVAAGGDRLEPPMGRNKP